MGLLDEIYPTTSIRTSRC